MDNYFAQKIIKNQNAKKSYFILFSCFLALLITGIVYLTGGTMNVYTNLMYLPIIIIAATNGKVKAIIGAILCGLLVGPLMPLEVGNNLLMQEPIGWMIRLIIYVVIGFVVGYFADYYKKEFEKNINGEKEIAEAQLATIFALVKLAESRDENTGEHIKRVAALCKILAFMLSETPDYKTSINDVYIENIYKASPLHDIGKVGVPDRILNKENSLSREEFDIMKTHTTIGANTLLELKNEYPHNKFLDLGIDITHFHHEKWDGSGYPLGLSGEQIPLSARIIALVDVYDALRSKRVYKEAFSHEVSLDIIKEGKGSQFDPTIVNVLIENEVTYKECFEKNAFNKISLQPESKVVKLLKS